MKKKQKFLALFVEILKKYKKIHKAGYLHGDVQPDHIFMISGKPVIIDWGLGVRVDDKSFNYRGGLVHFVAPEIAEQMTKKATSIPYDQTSEVYAIAAVFFLLFTGKTPISYGNDNFMSVPFNQKLKFIVSGNFISFEQASSPPFPELEKILQICLSPDKKMRYSSYKFLDELLRIQA